MNETMYISSRLSKPDKRSTRSRTSLSVNRLGHTLHELMLVIAFLSALMILTLRLMTRATHIHGMAVRTVTQLRIFETFEANLRKDINRAASLKSQSKSAIVLAISGEQQIRYEIQTPPRLIRQSIQGDVAQTTESWPLATAMEFRVTDEATAKGNVLLRIAMQDTTEPLIGVEVVGVCHGK